MTTIEKNTTPAPSIVLVEVHPVKEVLQGIAMRFVVQPDGVDDDTKGWAVYYRYSDDSIIHVFTLPTEVEAAALGTKLSVTANVELLYIKHVQYAEGDGVYQAASTAAWNLLTDTTFFGGGQREVWHRACVWAKNYFETKKPASRIEQFQQVIDLLDALNIDSNFILAFQSALTLKTSRPFLETFMEVANAAVPPEPTNKSFSEELAQEQNDFLNGARGESGPPKSALSEFVSALLRRRTPVPETTDAAPTEEEVKAPGPTLKHYQHSVMRAEKGTLVDCECAMCRLANQVKGNEELKQIFAEIFEGIDDKIGDKLSRSMGKEIKLPKSLTEKLSDIRSGTWNDEELKSDKPLTPDEVRIMSVLSLYMPDASEEAIDAFKSLLAKEKATSGTMLPPDDFAAFLNQTADEFNKRMRETNGSGKLGWMEALFKQFPTEADCNCIRCRKSKPKPIEQGSVYTVVSGDTLSSISTRAYGIDSFWEVLYGANDDKIKDPDLILPGQKLTIPVMFRL